MAARRLVIVMLVLLFVSTLAAALVPVDPPTRDEVGSEPSTAAAPPAGKRVTRAIDAGAKRERRIAIAAGDQLALTVRSPRSEQVEIAGLGELEDVDPDAPARFDLLPTQPGDHAVRLLGDGRVIATIEVAALDRELSESGRRSGKR